MCVCACVCERKKRGWSQREEKKTGAGVVCRGRPCARSLTTHTSNAPLAMSAAALYLVTTSDCGEKGRVGGWEGRAGEEMVVRGPIGTGRAGRRPTRRQETEKRDARWTGPARPQSLLRTPLDGWPLFARAPGAGTGEGGCEKTREPKIRRAVSPCIGLCRSFFLCAWPKRPTSIGAKRATPTFSRPALLQGGGLSPAPTPAGPARPRPP